MIIRKAAGLLRAVIEAPFNTIPTKTDTRPSIIPITVDFSKTNPPLVSGCNKKDKYSHKNRHNYPYMAIIFKINGKNPT